MADLHRAFTSFINRADTSRTRKAIGDVPRFAGVFRKLYSAGPATERVLVLLFNHGRGPDFRAADIVYESRGNGDRHESSAEARLNRDAYCGRIYKFSPGRGESGFPPTYRALLCRKSMTDGAR